LGAQQAELEFSFSAGGPSDQLEIVADEPGRGNDPRRKVKAFGATLGRARRTLKG
jgi:hypothetical protein